MELSRKAGRVCEVPCGRGEGKVCIPCLCQALCWEFTGTLNKKVCVILGAGIMVSIPQSGELDSVQGG